MPPPPPGAAPNYFPPPGDYAAMPGVPRSTTGLPLASWGIRLGGVLIDGVLSFGVSRGFDAAFRHTNALQIHWTMTSTANNTVTRYNLSILAFILTTVVFVAYATLMIGGRGQTLGMMAVGVRAVRAEDDGAVGYGRALGRAAFQIVLGWTVIVGLLSGLWPLWDAKRQTFHDKVARTVVIRSRLPG
jgi:uncharacterized RDD family membrane protein YckC